MPRRASDRDLPHWSAFGKSRGSGLDEHVTKGRSRAHRSTQGGSLLEYATSISQTGPQVLFYHMS